MTFFVCFSILLRIIDIKKSKTIIDLFLLLFFLLLLDKLNIVLESFVLASSDDPNRSSKNEEVKGNDSSEESIIGSDARRNIPEITWAPTGAPTGPSSPFLEDLISLGLIGGTKKETPKENEEANLPEEPFKENEETKPEKSETSSPSDSKKNDKGGPDSVEGSSTSRGPSTSGGDTSDNSNIEGSSNRTWADWVGPVLGQLGGILEQLGENIGNITFFK